MPQSSFIRRLNHDDVAQAVPLLSRINRNASTAQVQQWLSVGLTLWPSLQLASVDGDGNLEGIITGSVDPKDPLLGWGQDVVATVPNRGIGHRLLEAQLEVFRGLGCTRVRSHSPASLNRARPFFERHGFTAVERTVAHGLRGIDDGEEAYVFEKLLEPVHPLARSV